MQKPAETWQSPAPSQERQAPEAIRDGPISFGQSAEAHRPGSESTHESERDTPSSASYSQGQLGDDERDSEESAESAPENQPLPPRSSSLFIGDKYGTNGRGQPSKRSTASSGDTARTIVHPTANSDYAGTHSPRSANSSNKTPTQGSFDHQAAQPSTPYPLERTESPHDVRSSPVQDATYQRSIDTQSRPLHPPKSRCSTQNLRAEAVHAADPAESQKARDEPNSTDPNTIETPPGSDSAQLTRGQRPSDLRTGKFMGLPLTPQFSPLMDEHHTGLSPSLSRDLHSRGLSIGSIPSALDPERPPSPVSPFVPPRDDPTEQRGRTVIPVHHSIDHDFVDESSVERARRRSPSFSRPFQVSRSSEDSRPFNRPDLHDHPAYQQGADSGSDPDRPASYHPGLAARRDPSVPRQQAPEYQLEGMGAPDLPPVETNPRSRRRSRSSAFFRSLSPARNSSQPPLPSSSDSPHSAVRASYPSEDDSNVRRPRDKHEVRRSRDESKGRRTSIFGRTKTENSSRSDQAQSKENIMPRATTEPFRPPPRANTELDRPVKNESPASSKMSAASRFSKTLQRASTSVKPFVEQDSGKKKRFSAIGSLFGRQDQKRQSFRENAASAPQQYRGYGKYTGRPHGHTARFPLDEDIEERPPWAERPYPPTRIEPPGPAQTEQRRQPQLSPQRDLPAYVQDRMLRQTTAPQIQAQPPPPARQPSITTRPSPEIFYPSPNPSPFPSPQPTPILQQSTTTTSAGPGPGPGTHPPPARSISSWARFSATGRSSSKSRHSTQAAPPPAPMVSLAHINDFVSSPPPTNGAQPTQRSWMAGTTPTPGHITQPPQRSWIATEKGSKARGESPPPPPPPPKDDRFRQPNQRGGSRPLNSHARSGSLPLQGYGGQSGASPTAATAAAGRSDNRNTMIEQRQALPPLQTSVPGPGAGSRSGDLGSGGQEREHMTPEEKRKSRQEEIEKGHLSPATPTAATGKMSVVQEKEHAARNAPEKEDEEEEIVMSATSFPADMWQPDYMAWEGE